MNSSRVRLAMGMAQVIGMDCNKISVLQKSVIPLLLYSFA
jgi:hypothetical protein